MEESATRTSAKQRIIIGLIALLMLGSFVAIYVGIVMGQRDTTNAINPTKVAELKDAYTAKQAEVDAAAASLSDQYFEEMKGYKDSAVRSYNATSANEGGLQITDLKAGDGRTLAEDDTNYLAYYIGWCADESIFDSSFDNSSDPTELKAPLDASVGLIKGWNQGVVGMQLGGARELTIPGELAYGDTKEICGGKNSPLKFVVKAIEAPEPLATLMSELTLAQNRYSYYSQYGIDYDEYMKALQESNVETAGNASTEAGTTEGSTENTNK